MVINHRVVWLLFNIMNNMNKICISLNTHIKKQGKKYRPINEDNSEPIKMVSSVADSLSLTLWVLLSE